MKKTFKLMVEDLINPHSLKNRLAIVLIISSLIPLILIGLVSLYTITFEMKNRVEGAIQSNLKQVRINLENSLNNLDYVSKQLAYSGDIGEKFMAYMDGDDIYYKYLLKAEIRESISLISNTNPNIGVILYYSEKTKEVLFTNDTIVKGFNIQNLKLFSDSKESQYYVPNPSVNNSANSKTFSIVRKMDNNFVNDCYVYVETNTRIIEKLLSSNQYSIKANHILTDYKGNIVYNSGDPEFKIGEKFNVSRTEKIVQQDKDNYYFNEISQQGWNIFAVIRKKDFNRGTNQWIFTYILILALSLFISLIFALIIWRMIYRPIRAVKNEIMLMSENNYSSEFRFTHILEFDELLNKFYYMKLKVHELLNEIEKKERTKRYLEVQKLMHQINPHFLHNTLNTVQWLARENGQTKIARIIALLTKVLHYNMGKEGVSVTIGKEIDALQSYVELQKIRYDQKFNVQYNIENEILDAEIPRFILQPLVENSLYHGLNCDEGIIRVEAIRLGEKVRITVSDNGVGMDENEIKRNLNEEFDENQKAGLGIGISYVNKMIKVSYGNKGIINIHSKPGETKFIIEIPYKKSLSEHKIPQLMQEEDEP
ncbi:MAG TPA: histidine kinase [Ruminiclostridium sp.]